MATNLKSVLAKFIGATNADRLPDRLGDVDGFPDRLAGGGPTLAFTFATPDASGEMLMLDVGTGPAVHTHTADILQPQAQEVGPYHNRFGANVVVWRGARLDGTTPYGTDGSGDPLAQTPWLWFQPGPRTNLNTNSSDLTGWSSTLTHTVSYDQNGLEGVPNTATLAIDDRVDTGQLNYKDITIPDDSNNVTMVYALKRDATQTSFWEVRNILVGGTSQRVDTRVDPDTGALYNETETGTVVSESVVDGDFIFVYLQVLNNGTGNTTARTGVIAAESATIDGAYDYSLTGQMTVMNVGVFHDMTIEEVKGLGPIYTAGASAATDKTVYEYAEVNHETENGVYFFELYMTQGDGAITNPTDANARLISFGTDGYIGVTAADGKLSANDGTNAAASDAAVPAGASKCALVYSATDSKMQLYVDGDWGPEATFSGDMSINDDIELGRLTDFCFGLANGKHYSGISSLAAGKTLVEGLAA